MYSVWQSLIVQKKKQVGWDRAAASEQIEMISNYTKKENIGTESHCKQLM